MKKLWLNVIPYNKEIAIAALESGAEAVVLPDGTVKPLPSGPIIPRRSPGVRVVMRTVPGPKTQ